MWRALVLAFAACSRGEPSSTCGANLLATPADPAARGPWAVGARTVTFDGARVEIWYPALKADTPHARYDLREVMPAREAQKIPDRDNAWLDCDCQRDLPIDRAHGPYPVVMFLHGAAAFRAQSQFLTTHWASRGFIVIAPDLPGVGLYAMLGGEEPTYPLLFPVKLLDAIAKPAANDPFTAVRAQMTDRVAVVGHSLGAMLANTTDGRSEIRVRIALAGAAPIAAPSTLQVAGATDGIAPPSTLQLAGAADGISPPSRQVTNASISPPSPPQVTNTPDGIPPPSPPHVTDTTDGISPPSPPQVTNTTDGIPPPNRDARPQPGATRARTAVIPGAGHLAFTDLCLVGADRGGSLAIARAHGIEVPAMIATLAVDGCRPTDAPFATTAPMIRAVTTGVLEETLHCRAFAH